jgi:cell division protein FtsW (lipid II flippase)
MIDVFNGTQVVSTIAASDLSIFLSITLAVFGTVVIAYLVMDYLHNKHMENLGKQLVDAATVGIQADQSMIAVAIAAMQGMDITDKVLGKPGSQTEKKTQ